MVQQTVEGQDLSTVASLTSICKQTEVNERPSTLRDY